MYTCSVLFHRIPQCRTSTQSMQFTQHVQPTPPVDFILHQEVHNSYIKSYRHWNLNWLYVNENRSTRAKCLDLLCWLVLSVCIYLYCKMCSILFKFKFFWNFFGFNFYVYFLKTCLEKCGFGIQLIRNTSWKTSTSHLLERSRTLPGLETVRE